MGQVITEDKINKHRVLIVSVTKEYRIFNFLSSPGFGSLDDIEPHIFAGFYLGVLLKP